MPDSDAFAMPTSCSQRGLWLTQQLDPGNPFYVVPMTLRLRGRLDLGALERSLEGLVARHESLRSTFVERDGEILAVIHADLRIPLTVTDLSGLPPAAREDERARIVAEEARRPFDLATGPLQRQMLLVLGPEEHQLLIMSHHVITDAWSQDVYFRELRTLYEGYTGGREPQLPELGIQYADYALWQQELLDAGDFDEHLAYWREKLRGAGITALPSSRERVESAEHLGASYGFDIPASAVQVLRDLAAQEQATLYMALLAVFKTVFARSTGETDISVAGAIAGRTRLELDQVIGFFVNTLILRSDLSGAPSFRECLRRVRATCLEAYEHQDLPFEKVVEELAPVRDPSRNPLFQIMVVLQNAPAEQIKLGALDIDYDLVPNNTAKFDLNVVLIERQDGSVRCVFEYDTALFDEPAMARLGERAVTAAVGAAARPDDPISELPVLGAAEERLLDAWCSGPTDSFDLPPHLHGCFEQSVDRFPDRIAVSDGKRTLTYAELDARANQVAHRLIGHGFAPETAVGVCAHRDVDLLVALYGVMKAGLAYLPLDPGYPPARLRHMLESSGAAAVVGHEELLADLPTEGLALVALDGGHAEQGGVPTARPEVPVTGAQLCYVIYTSGSTGTPKGVANEHRSLVGLMAYGRELFSDGELAGFSATCSASFDLSVMELFIPLSHGGTLLIARDALDLAAVPFPVPVRAMHTVPSIAAELVRAGGLPATLETVVLAGEALPAELVGRLGDRIAGLRVVNIYGVTEAACSSTAAFPGAAEHGSVPIGAPIRGVRTYVLDADLRPVPIGTPGQLYLGGPATGRCYIGNPRLSAERFLPDPFDRTPGARMYRTGDSVRWNSNGELEYHGRGDSQTKLRGVRIELGELESVARTCDDVAQAVAVVTRAVQGHEILVCYLTALPGRQVDTDQVLGQLAERIPRFLVPGRLVVIDAFPLNPNGKIDRAALTAQEPAAEPAERPGRATAPLAGTEARIAEVWSRVLGLDRVGRHDNFFDVGGHSLLLLRVRSILAAELGHEIPIVDFFSHPTVAAIARHIEAGGRSSATSAEVVLPEAAPPSPASTGPKIAVVGMQCRVPGAEDVEQFWENLLGGRESISTLSAQELEAAGVPAEKVARPEYVARGGFLRGVGEFDAEYFGFSPREAELLDPQQRLLLEVATEALQRSGHDPQRFPGLIGIYAGVGFGDYAWNNLLPNIHRLEETGGFQLGLAIDKDFTASRVAYKLDLRGPAITVQTACSTSLVAVHLAVQALLNGETDLALAGGSSILVPARGYLYQEGGITSPDGHCRPFDAKSAGSVPGSGAGVVVLRRLEDALADGDTIHAVITGTAVNNDGAGKVGYTAPSVEGQVAAIRGALRAAGTRPEEIGYVEAHGTATSLGDPIEVAALSEAFGASPALAPASCALGSVKSNIGHLDAAAGVTGLIKAILTVEHGVIPPTLHYTEPNPHLDLDRTPFHVPTSVTPWPATRLPRRAGASSLGMGGTNAHVILEQAPERGATPPATRRPHVLPLSAKTPQALDQATARLAEHLGRNAGLALPDIAHTLQYGRTQHPYRRVVIADSTEQATTLLHQVMAAGSDRSYVDDTVDHAGVALYYGPAGNGVGTEFLTGLVAELPAFRRHLSALCDALTPRVAGRVRTELMGSPGRADQARSLSETAVLVAQHALTLTLAEHGVRPSAALGTGLGALLAAAAAGVLPVADVFEVALAVAQAAPDARLAAASQELRRVPLAHPALALYCAARGRWVEAEEATDPGFWAAQVVEPTAPDLREALAQDLDGPVIDLSLDSEHALGGEGAASPGAAGPTDAVVLPVFGRRAEDVPASYGFSAALAGLWLAGVPVELAAAGIERPSRVLLPTYAFQRKRHWLDVPSEPVRAAADATERLPEVSRWFYSAGWTRTSWPVADPDEKPGSWLVVTDPDGLGSLLADWLRERGHLVVTAEPGESFTQLGSQHFAFDLSSPEDAERLVSVVRSTSGGFPAHLVHTLCAVPTARPDVRGRSLHSVLFLARALLRCQVTGPLRYTVVTNRALAVAGEPDLVPEHAMAAGACRVIPQEIPGVHARLVDVEAAPTVEAGQRLAAQLAAELAAEPALLPADVAYRGEDRWVQHYEPVQLPEAGPSLLREGGVYLLLGGLGTVGQSLAAHLAHARSAKLAVVHRQALPPRSQWPSLLRAEPDSLVASRIAAVSRLEEAGAEVLTFAADLADPAQMREVIRQVTDRFGALNGVLHCAGTVAEGPALALDELDRDTCDQQVRSKVEGLQVLAEVTDGLTLDFVLLVSSLSPVLGGLGLAAYAAANAHLDLFAHRQRRLTGATWLAVNWEGWRPLPHGLPETGSGVVLGESLAALAMSQEDGGPVLERLLRGRPSTQIVVSTADLGSRLARWVRSDWDQEQPTVAGLVRYERPDLRTPYLEPRDAVERRLAEIWQRILGIERIGVRDSFFELGGSSLLAIHLVTAIQREFQVAVPLHAIVSASTVERLAEAVTGADHSAEEDAVVVPLHVVEDPEAVFFWIHPLGGTVLCYHELARLVGPRTSSYGLQAPMLFEGPDSYTDLELLAARYVTEILRVQPEGPYRIGGWSGGGIISVVVARQLAAAGREVRYVGVIEAEAPRPDMPVVFPPHELLGALLNRPGLRAEDLPVPPTELFDGTQEVRHAAAVRWIAGRGLVPADQVERIARLFLVEARIFDLVTPGTLQPYPGTVHVYRAEQGGDRTGDSAMGWGVWAPESRARQIPGTHHNVLHRPQVGELAELIRAAALD
ncbi:amino acid adenylation domain-containing protein [Kitasatospora sp. GAS204A]|uniref:non-ribosomal peptide synthetase n=1 Tax=unclassified Kitasatospora TaxID=2633591 RepID=UPI002473ABD0|nr:non-ribosomal peptide synthetase [Kitasatospora sp. GAS204B]MDH6118948.1 amino acid adenylation domain-containing protein [Kitasatospora sp. GAS204B]